jgi:hypothetical protein
LDAASAAAEGGNMNCTTCKNRYIRGGWVCWSGNKKSLGKCNNGNPSYDRTIYRKGETKREDELP